MKLNVPIVIIGVIVAFGLLAFGRFTSSDTQQVYRLLSEADESESEMAALRSSIRR